MEKLEQTPMSDKVKERIEKEAATYVSHNWNNVNPDTEKAYIAGATAEHPNAWNEAIDAVIENLKKQKAHFWLSELEALKHKQL